MDLRRIVPDNVVAVAVPTALVGLTRAALLYGGGRSSELLSSEVANIAVYLFESILAWYAYRLPRRKDYALLPLLPWLPIVQQVLTTLVDLQSSRPPYHLQVLVWYSIEGLWLSLFYVALRSAFDVIRPSDTRTPPPVGTATPPAVMTPAADAIARRESLTDELETHTRVTESVRIRSRQMSDNARLSMIVMILLVLVGGGASVGLWFFGQLDRLRTLEVERNKLVTLSSNLERLGGEVTAEQAEAVKQLRKFVQDNYGQTASYQALLRDIAERTQTSWPDIAIRATVAILTLFLVQIFFAVYKYSQHLSNLLAAKAEALDLLGVSAEDRQNLRKEMVSLAREATPGFTSGPNTPLQELLEILEKLKKTKTE